MLNRESLLTNDCIIQSLRTPSSIDKLLLNFFVVTSVFGVLLILMILLIGSLDVVSIPSFFLLSIDL